MTANRRSEAQGVPVVAPLGAGDTCAQTNGPREWQAKIGKIPVAVA
jgi:hypothetical protein